MDSEKGNSPPAERKQGRGIVRKHGFFINTAPVTDNSAKSGTIGAESTPLPVLYDDLVCSDCSGPGVDKKMAAAFGMLLCSSCKKRILLVSQTEAAEKYLLSRSDLSLLRKMEVPNPISALWSRMMLYLEEDVQALAAQRFADLGQEKERRRLLLQQKRLKRIKKKAEELRRAARARTKPEDPGHSHAFTSDGRCTCGLKLDFEEI